SGTAWRRYNEDGYGEHADGSPFDGAGIGRIWPLLAGERAHYELAAGRADEAEKLLRSMEGFANESGLISEQVWDAPDIPERQLHFGRPSGSAMPLVWAHAEYVKLRRSLDDGKVFDMPRHSAERFLNQPARAADRTYWRFGQECETIAKGRVLRLELLAPARVRWSGDEWRTSHDGSTTDSGLGLHYLDLPSDRLHEGDAQRFTFYWPQSDRWEGADFQVELRGS
ncbi:MAG TPA: glucoamylase, partial [Pirellulales bacterium]|nr:glucoamylase [Pirellulales bacterium]